MGEELCRRCLASNKSCAKAWEFLRGGRLQALLQLPEGEEVRGRDRRVPQGAAAVPRLPENTQGRAREGAAGLETLSDTTPGEMSGKMWHGIRASSLVLPKV